MRLFGPLVLALVSAVVVLAQSGEETKDKAADAALANILDTKDEVTDKVKEKFQGLVSKGLGKDVDQLQQTRRKMRILKKIGAEQGRRTRRGKKGKKTDLSAELKKVAAQAKQIDNNDDVMSDLVYQDDIILTPDQLDRKIASAFDKLGYPEEQLKKIGVTKRRRPKRQAILGDLWTSPIAFSFDSNVLTPVRNMAREAFKLIANQTCLDFVESSSTTPRIQFRNIDTYRSNDCFSYLGYNPSWYSSANCDTCPGAGKHPINLNGSHCQNFGSVAHEIMHALGIEHHQIRSDRDDYITLTEDGVDDDNYNPILTDEDSDNHGTKYDYGSVMHYQPKTDGVLVAEAISSEYQSTIGTRQGPGFQDITLINRRYECTCPDNSVLCLNGGYANPKKCDTCVCPSGFGGKTCGYRNIETNQQGATLMATRSDQCYTLKASVGLDDPNNVEQDYYVSKWYHIRAPYGKKVQLFVYKAGSSPGKSYYRGNGCSKAGMDFKLNSADFDRVGPLYCGDDPSVLSTSSNIITSQVSDKELAMIRLYSKWNKFNLEVKYRYVDANTDTEDVPTSCQPCTTNCPAEPTCSNTGGTTYTDAKCDTWRDLNYCLPNMTYTKDMSTNCAKSCGTCQNKCRDWETPARCSQYAEHCVPGMQYYTWTTKWCPNTCGLCSCQDWYSSCATYASHCQPGMQYYGFMQRSCPKTCSFC